MLVVQEHLKLVKKKIVLVTTLFSKDDPAI